MKHLQRSFILVCLSFATSLALGPVVAGSSPSGPAAPVGPLYLSPPVHYAAGISPRAVVVGDLNGDGHPDLAAANAGSDDVSVLLGNVDGSFQSAVSYGAGAEPYALALGDLNADSRLDLVVANHGNSAPPMTFELPSVHVSPGDFLYFVVDPKGDFGCDSTALDLTIQGTQTWNLASDFRLAPDQANPNPDSFGNPGVWYFLQSASFVRDPASYTLIGEHITNAFGIVGLEQWQGSEGASPTDRLPAVGVNATGTVQEFGNHCSWPPGAVRVHPSSSRLVVVGWRSPIEGEVSLHGSFADMDTSCGNGIAWFVDDAAGTLAQVEQGGVSVLLGNGDGTFQPAVEFVAGARPVAVALGDLNGDGDLDVAAASGAGNAVSVLLGNGDGSLQSAVNLPAGQGPCSLSLGDLNGDGNLDLAMGNDGSSLGDRVSILLGNGDGTFQAEVQQGVGSWIALGDMNGDGILDLVGTDFTDHGYNPAGVVVLHLGNGDGTFHVLEGGLLILYGEDPLAVAIGNLTGGSAPDVAVVLNATDMLVVAGVGDGTFDEATPPSALYGTVGQGVFSIAAGDLNGDGMQDLVTANVSGNDLSVLLSSLLPAWYIPSSVLGSPSEPSLPKWGCVFSLVVLPAGFVLFLKRGRRRG